MTDGWSALRGAHGRLVFSRRVRALARALDELLPRDSASVLDVGCGDGSVGDAVRRLRPGIAWQGAEAYPRPGCRVPVLAFDGRTLPLPDASVDHVVFVDVLHHAADPMALLREARRVARRGVIVKDHLRDRPLARPVLAFMDWVGNRAHGVPMTYAFWSSDEWARAWAAAGLRPVRRAERLGLYPAPARPLFEWGLHHLTLLEPAAPAPSRR
ncbi:MAG TPA: class I SAM-dependent methyltransferase [Anaeromyxobacter sp.]|nr:class I SAM-dependent methyltransferase [Anaeromyxobacter sp.]